MGTHIFGVRHHGPGCARSLRDALTRLEPDIVLVEGPPDAQEALPLLMREEMVPPVALLIYAPDDPQRAVYYPFTHFSPEWQALRYAAGAGIPARFMDLPQALQLAREPRQADAEASAGPTEAPATAEDGAQALGGGGARARRDGSAVEVKAEEAEARVVDPIGALAEAAGYSDHELWWEREIEQRHASEGLFEGILEAMSAVRAELTPRDEEEAQREAHMRQTIRAAQREGYARIAVVCGAWHGPALATLGAEDGAAAKRSAKADAALLAGLKRVKVEATWIPWTNSRLAYRSGYGAGIVSPGWYAHLWAHEEQVAIRWVTYAARLLREEGLDASSASVIEAVRLAEALAAMSDLPMPGMHELHEAMLATLCNGEAAPMALIRERLEIGEVMGEVPPDAPAVPLQRDVEALQRRLKLKPSAEVSRLELDLRKEMDRARSQLLHRLRLLGVMWGEPQRVSGSVKGSFHEHWQLKWEVEFVVRLIEQNIWGNTLVVAASGFARHSADEATELPQVTRVLDAVILAELPDAIEHLLGQVERRAAVAADVRHLLDALPPLARVARYGDVRGTAAERVTPVIDALFGRALVGLPVACAALDDDAAQAMVESINHAQECVGMLNRDEQRAAWLEALRGLADREAIHGRVRGRCVRLLLEQGALDEEELHRLARLALSPVVAAPQAAAWIGGVVLGSGLLLLHQDGLWRALDAWMSALEPDAFVALLPLLRRAFSEFQPPERRAMGEKVRWLRGGAVAAGGAASGAQNDEMIQPERAALVLPMLAQILGVAYDKPNE